MIDKIRAFLIILLILILIFGLFYSIIKIISNSSKEDILITKNNISEYTIDSNLVTSYNTFFYINNCFENFVQACEEEKYNELYDLYIGKYMSKTDKNTVIKELKSLNFVTKEFTELDGEISYKLDKVYRVKNDEYILNIKINESIINLVMKISDTKSDKDYHFAFVM